MKKRNQTEISDISSGKSDPEIIYYASIKQSDKYNGKSSGSDKDNRFVENSNVEATKQAVSSRRKFAQQKSQRIDDSDSEDFRQKSLDIVVDVHCENESSGRKAKARTESLDKHLDKRWRSNEAKRNDPRKTESLDSLDLIEEIKDTPRSDDGDGHKTKSWLHEFEATPSEVSGRRRRWKTAEAADGVDDVSKSLRKRWTGANGGKDEKISSFMGVKPKPAPRRSAEPKNRGTVKSEMAFKNEAYLPDNEEEVLTIETDYLQEDTKIQMSLTTVNKIKVLDRTEETAMIEEVSEKDYEDNCGGQIRVLDRPKSEMERRNNFMLDKDMSGSRQKPRSKSVGELEGRKSEDKDSDQDTTISSFSEEEKTIKRIKSGSRSSKKRRKKRRSKSESSKRSQSSRLEKNLKERTKTKEPKEKKRKKKKPEVMFISVTIHRSDVLEIDYVTRHPMVKVHIMDSVTGEYLDNDGNSNPEISYLQPIISAKFDFKENRSMTPVWEDELIFEHDFRDLLRPEPDNVIIFFEIVDILTFVEARQNYDKYGSEGCWYKIAWAFLKPVGATGTLHINKKLRLQLYRPFKPSKFVDKTTCEVFYWWKFKKKKPYPSSLYVTVTAVEQPKLEPIFYDQLTFNEVSEIRSDSQLPAKTSESESAPTWTRSADQPCKIPNDVLFETEVSENGCFHLSFSNSGKYLAYVASEENDFPIFIYKLEGIKIQVRFNGHKYFVYSLTWSHDDRYLLSVSSDQTARIWDVKEKIIEYIHLLPHPSYVYAGKFNIETSSIVVTGCYDKIIRVWSKSRRSKTYDLSQELEIHLGFINTLCFLPDDTLLSADSVGLIVSWTVRKSGKRLTKKEWLISRKIKIPRMEGVIINCLSPHPRENKLLVHSRNNSLILLDLSTGEIVQKFVGLENERIQISSCISPCGNLVLSGGEDSTLNVWNLNSGRLMAKYRVNQPSSVPITCVSYHSFEHMLAFCIFEVPSSVKIFKFERHSDGTSVGLVLLSDEEEPNLPQSKEETFKSQGRSSLKTNSHSHDLEFDETHFSGSTNDLLEGSENQKSLVMKLQKFIETIPVPQFGNSTRMNSIIDKIDRILSNASSSRDADDLESGRVAESSLRLDLRSNTSDLSGETIRMKELEGRKKARPRSAKNSCYSKKLEQMRSILSESPANRKGSMDVLIDDEEFNLESNTLNNVDSLATTSFFLDFEGSSLSDERIRKVPKRANNYDNPDSDGTYVVEKGDVEQNDDVGSSGDSSVKSNVTFTIENEVPVPKPRKVLK